MRVDATAISETSVLLVYTPSRLQQLLHVLTRGLLGAKPRSLIAVPLHRNASVWIYLDDRRVVDDASYAAIVDAVTELRLSLQLQRIHEAARKAAEKHCHLVSISCSGNTLMQVPDDPDSN